VISAILQNTHKVFARIKVTPVPMTNFENTFVLLSRRLFETLRCLPRLLNDTTTEATLHEITAVKGRRRQTVMSHTKLYHKTKSLYFSFMAQKIVLFSLMINLGNCASATMEIIAAIILMLRILIFFARNVNGNRTVSVRSMVVAATIQFEQCKRKWLENECSLQNAVSVGSDALSNNININTTPGKASRTVSISDKVAKYTAHCSCLDLGPKHQILKAIMFKILPPTISTGSITFLNAYKTTSIVEDVNHRTEKWEFLQVCNMVHMYLWEACFTINLTPVGSRFCLRLHFITPMIIISQIVLIDVKWLVF